ncbi:endolytic transglycosylase MltG [Desulfurobacterium sp.]
MKRYLFIAVCLILAIFMLKSILFFTYNRKINTRFYVKRGESTNEVIVKLSRSGIIKSAFLSKFYAKFKKIKVKAGEYSINGIYSDKDILDILSKGQVHYAKFVIPEGYNLFDVASVVEASFRNCKKESFLKLAFNATFVHSKGFNSTSLEGFLFPDTYLVSDDAFCKDVIDAMVENFKRKTNPLFRDYKPPSIVEKALGSVDIKKIITVASIVEKETPVRSEKPIIAGIIYKRLLKKMPLQCDSTVIYAYRLEGILKRGLKGKDIKNIKSPYNTYFRKGLPPTPICNPGIDSIKAAMYPANTPFLYFFAVDGKHIFSKTYKEHLAKMRKYYNRHVR